MQFRYKLQYQLVKILGKSNKEAKQLILDQRVAVNNLVATDNILVRDEDTISLDCSIIRAGATYQYLAYYKPRGIETTLHPDIADGLRSVLSLSENFYHIGRLDKESEGLLLLSDDGSLGKSLLDKSKGIIKKYEVSVNKKIDAAFLSFLENGVSIMGKTTLPCKTLFLNDTTFEICLIEGMNRQIRRMCHKAGYEVEKLLRTEFAGINLDLNPGQYRALNAPEIEHLRTL